jgi:shikimate kinase
VGKRVALIGHSGAGKSACLLSLEIDRKAADMDVVLGTKQCPKLVSALGWLANDGGVPNLVVVSNHEQMLKEMHKAKLAGQYADHFSKVQLVYLHKPKDELLEHLANRTAGGRNREPADVQYTLDHYDRFHILFSQLADQTVECSQKSVEVVAAEIRGIVQSLSADPAEPAAAPDPAS